MKNIRNNYNITKHYKILESTEKIRVSNDHKHHISDTGNILLLH